MAIRIVAWPMSFIVMAKGARGAFVWTEGAANVVHVGLAIVAVRRFGLTGAGIAFLGLYVFYACLVYAVVRRISGFRWSAANRKTGLLFLSSIAVVFCSFYVIPTLWAAVLGAVMAVFSGLYSLHVLLHLLSEDQILRQIGPLLKWVPFVPSRRSTSRDAR